MFYVANGKIYEAEYNETKKGYRELTFVDFTGEGGYGFVDTGRVSATKPVNRQVLTKDEIIARFTPEAYTKTQAPEPPKTPGPTK